MKKQTKLVIAALKMAVYQCQSNSVIHHSDKVSQYTSLWFSKQCKSEEIKPSTGSTGDCYDNAMCERFFAMLECELLNRTTFKNKQHAEFEVFQHIEGWHNPHRRHSSIDYMSPINYDSTHLSETNKPNQNLSITSG